MIRGKFLIFRVFNFVFPNFVFWVLSNVMKLDFDIYVHVCTAEQALAGDFPRDFLGIALPEQPNKYYLIIRLQRIVLEADSSIQMIMEKLQSYKSRVSLNFEVPLPLSISLVRMFNILII